MRHSRALAPVAALVGLAVIVAVLPSFVSAFRAQQLAYVAIYLTALIGLNILTGYTGQISLGHGAFMAIGGYTTAILMTEHGVKTSGRSRSRPWSRVSSGSSSGSPRSASRVSTSRSPPSRSPCRCPP
jgi:ABC-type branched-subunit amino acid transport system permease subunit